MPTYRTKDFSATLLRVGFRVDSTHHEMYWYYIGEEKFSLRTRTSHGEKEFATPSSMPAADRSAT